MPYYMKGFIKLFLFLWLFFFFLGEWGVGGCWRFIVFTWTADDWLWLQIGSFGAITRIVNIVPNREDLLKVAAAGPLAGFTVGIVLLLLGFILPPSDGIGIIVDAGIFHESFLAGGIGECLLIWVTNDCSSLWEMVIYGCQFTSCNKLSKICIVKAASFVKMDLWIKTFPVNCYWLKVTQIWLILTIGLKYSSYGITFYFGARKTRPL